ncbi:serine protease [Saccharomonospora sp. NPDC046836]|uniref:S1 family peptidase n=1 Tax=Saccharomonospora sp. NPDC046836 TaxID=3156921 RepID=UPI0033F7F5E0
MERTVSMYWRPFRVLLVALLVVMAIGAPPAHATTVDLSGTVALSNCSGSLVTLAGLPASAPALVLTNGHCLEEGFPEPGEVIVDEPTQRTFTVLGGDGRELGTVRASRLVYATMTGTDAALYQLSARYTDIERAYGVTALELAVDRPRAGTSIAVASGYWKWTYRCSIDGFAAELHEGSYVWQDSIRYTPECQTIGGTSGSPIIDVTTGKVVGVNNTGNESGQHCTMNNPCEVDESGQVTVRKGIGYGQQTHLLAAYLSGAGDFEGPGGQLARLGGELAGLGGGLAGLSGGLAGLSGGLAQDQL